MVITTVKESYQFETCAKYLTESNLLMELAADSSHRPFSTRGTLMVLSLISMMMLSTVAYTIFTDKRLAAHP